MPDRRVERGGMETGAVRGLGVAESPPTLLYERGLEGLFRGLLVGLTDGELGALEGAFALFERLGESQNLFVGLGV